MIILDHNNTICMGYMMEYSLSKPLQSEKNWIHIDINPKKYYTDEPSAHTVTISDGTIFIILYGGGLTYIPVWCSTPG